MVIGGMSRFYASSSYVDAAMPNNIVCWNTGRSRTLSPGNGYRHPPAYPTFSTAEVVTAVTACLAPQVLSSGVPEVQVFTFCELSADCERLLERAMTQQALSARAHDPILKVARTIADLEDTPQIAPKHIAEAIQYRSLDRTYWA